MNFIKSTIAAVSVVACCIGNELPAKANLAINNLNSAQVHFESGYETAGCSYVATALIYEKQQPINDLKNLAKLHRFADRCDLSIY